MLKHLPSSFAWTAAILAAIGTLLLVYGAHTCYRNWQFSGRVERVMGSVTDRYITVSHGRHGSTTHYHICYRYSDEQGWDFSENTTVTSTTYYELTSPGAVPIKFLPQQHDIDRIDLPAEDSSYTRTAWGFTLGGLALGGVGWYVFIGLERLIFYRRWLRKNGIRCAGHVDRLEASPITVNKRTVYYMVYTYTDPLGRKHMDDSEGMTEAQYGSWHDGDSVDVFCDPRDNSRSAVRLDKYPR
jgi:hypothetical protein